MLETGHNDHQTKGIRIHEVCQQTYFQAGRFRRLSCLSACPAEVIDNLGRFLVSAPFGLQCGYGDDARIRRAPIAQRRFGMEICT
jgi:hypothetical protein